LLVTTALTLSSSLAPLHAAAPATAPGAATIPAEATSTSPPAPPTAGALSIPTPLEGRGITGTVVRYANMPSKNVTARNVDIWLPPGYRDDASRRYPVVYMHDGQNLYYPAISFGGVDWAVDEAMTRLIAAKEVRPAIIVGIWNVPERFAEYMPQRAIKGRTVVFNVPGIKDVPPEELLADRYVAFLVEELKPFIDANYRTLPGRADTYVMGSSMGGQISQYAMSLHPEVFGGAGCVSTHWPAGDGIAIDDFAAHLPDPATHKYWFDFGTKTLDSTYEPYQRRVDEILRKAGYVEGVNWITRKFPGTEHSEKAWRERVDQPLRFLIGR
jgi:predicted alpha/beta superfamily hydrolase